MSNRQWHCRPIPLVLGAPWSMGTHLFTPESRPHGACLASRSFHDTRPPRLLHKRPHLPRLLVFLRAHHIFASAPRIIFPSTFTCHAKMLCAVCPRKCLGKWERIGTWAGSFSASHVRGASGSVGPRWCRHEVSAMVMWRGGREEVVNITVQRRYGDRVEKQLWWN